MPSRYFQRRSTGEWLNVMMGSGGPFDTTLASHITSVELGFGLPGDVEAVEVEDADPRVPPLLQPLPQPPPPPNPILARIDALILPAAVKDVLKEIAGR